MPELLSPGVVIEEVAAPVTTITGVSTSNMGILGYSDRGPTDEATLVTSFDQYTRKFGPLVRQSLLGLSLAAFFTNGGRRAYVTRVVPADAVLADARILSSYLDETIETGDGVLLVFSKTSTTTPLHVAEGFAPLKKSSISVRYRIAGAPVVGGVARNRANSANLTTATGVAQYEGRINPSALPANDPVLDSVVRATVTLKYSANSVVRSIVIPAGTSSIVSGTLTVGPDTVTATFDHRTGAFSFKATGGLIPILADNAVNITVDFTPAAATSTFVDDGAGAWTGATGTVDYATGAYTFTVATAPHNYAKIVAAHTVAAWDLNPISKGTWANRLRLRLRGSVDAYTTSTASYSLYDMFVELQNVETLAWEVQEQYLEVSLTDPDSDMYLPDVLNELSDLLTVVEPGSDLPVPQLSGKQYTQVLAGGDETAPAATITGTLSNYPIAARSVSIAYTDSTGTARVITDDGVGNLVGDVDSTGVNTINYTLGTVDFKVSGTIRGNSLVVATYAKAPVEVNHSEQFGDTTKQWTVGAVNFFVTGTNGTFNSVNWGRSQFTEQTALLPTNKGLYAFERIDEILQVVLPDFAGDVTMTADLLDYAELRASMPQGGDRFIILTTRKGLDPQEAVDWLRYSLARSSDYAAVYWPWVKVADPLSNNRPLVMPPLGHIAGVYARTDNNRNVGKTPAGTVDGALTFLTGLEYVATQGERDLVYPNKINPLIQSTQTGIAVWGGRTISIQAQWRYVNARRLFMFLEKSVYNDTFWIVFENNGPGLWGRIKTQLDSFLFNLFNDGYFKGANPQQAYFVVVDDTNNTAASQDAGQVLVDLGAAANKPAEFARFRFAQMTQT